MKFKSIIEYKFFIIFIVFAITACTVIWDYFYGGVPTHYLLAREDLPGISNWWGILAMPLMAFIALILVEKRKDKNERLGIESSSSDSRIITNFILALVFGTIASFFWEFDLDSILPYFMLLPIVISLFKPLHYGECLLGFALGMLYTFGGILPIVVGTILLLLSFITNKTIGKGFELLFKRIM